LKNFLIRQSQWLNQARKLVGMIRVLVAAVKNLRNVVDESVFMFNFNYFLHNLYMAFGCQGKTFPVDQKFE
jgi:hypothetical protein